MDLDTGDDVISKSNLTIRTDMGEFTNRTVCTIRRNGANRLDLCTGDDVISKLKNDQITTNNLDRARVN